MNMKQMRHSKQNNIDTDEKVNNKTTITIHKEIAERIKLHAKLERKSLNLILSEKFPPVEYRKKER